MRTENGFNIVTWNDAPIVSSGAAGTALQMIPASAIQALATLTNIGSVCTATTATPHNLPNGSSAQILGANDAAFNGYFVMNYISATSFSYQAASVPAVAFGQATVSTFKARRALVYADPANTGPVTFGPNSNATSRTLAAGVEYQIPESIGPQDFGAKFDLATWWFKSASASQTLRILLLSITVMLFFLSDSARAQYFPPSGGGGGSGTNYIAGQGIQITGPTIAAIGNGSGLTNLHAASLDSSTNPVANFGIVNIGTPIPLSSISSSPGTVGQIPSANGSGGFYFTNISATFSNIGPWQFLAIPDGSGGFNLMTTNPTAGVGFTINTDGGATWNGGIETGGGFAFGAGANSTGGGFSLVGGVASQPGDIALGGTSTGTQSSVNIGVGSATGATSIMIDAGNSPQVNATTRSVMIHGVNGIFLISPTTVSNSFTVTGAISSIPTNKAPFVNILSPSPAVALATSWTNTYGTRITLTIDGTLNMAVAGTTTVSVTNLTTTDSHTFAGSTLSIAGTTYFSYPYEMSPSDVIQVIAVNTGTATTTITKATVRLK